MRLWRNLRAAATDHWCCFTGGHIHDVRWYVCVRCGLTDTRIEDLPGWMVI
jgi:hypothetical protein